MSAAITLEDVGVRYGSQVAIHDVHAIFETGSLTALAGPNGSGKSTLLKVIAGIVRPQRGRMVVDPALRGQIAYLPQGAGLARDFPITVLEAVCAGFWRQTGEGGALTLAMRAQAQEALERVGLGGFGGRQIGALSGGQFQRVLFARTIVEDARVILLDEPFAAVDQDTTARLIAIIMDWHAQGRTVICVLHDLMLIRKYFPDSVVLAGRCIGRGHTHDLFRQKLLSFDLDMAELHTAGEEIPVSEHADGAECPCGHDHGEADKGGRNGH
ncbi:MAG: ABC transporter ATP-binding protein [Rhodospirillales bacterium]|nr:ABC transporter ATP-binding protein [Alphaproteobacteria bacterium]MCB9986838.1 ABC transporter ATP-binding protein [Rhodospirillales bacterium]USO08399.1 MAG: ABC transporter ATP-binding protein [Rhodospirillales bacterium]